MTQSVNLEWCYDGESGTASLLGIPTEVYVTLSRGVHLFAPCYPTSVDGKVP